MTTIVRDLTLILPRPTRLYVSTALYAVSSNTTMYRLYDNNKNDSGVIMPSRRSAWTYGTLPTAARSLPRRSRTKRSRRALRT